MFNIGDFVFDTATGANVQVMERIELWGYTSYKVFNPANGSVYKATGEQLKMGGNEAQLDENYLRYVMLLSKIKNETSAGVLSSLSSSPSSRALPSSTATARRTSGFRCGPSSKETVCLPPLPQRPFLPRSRATG